MVVRKGKKSDVGNRMSEVNSPDIKRGRCRKSEIRRTISRRGQLKIQQMAFMLMAITLFFVLAGMFVLVISTSNLKEGALALEEKNAMLLVSKLANSPEFSCGESFGSNRINCVDADKIMMLKENIAGYAGFWGVSNIEIRKTGESLDVCTLGNYPDCGIIRLRDSEITSEYSNFVSLCWKDDSGEGLQNKCEVARLMVGYDG